MAGVTSKENGKKGGRPSGARTLIKVLDYFDKKELKDFWEDLKKRAKTDNKIALYFAEQMSGKAVQAVQVSGEDGGPIKHQIIGMKIIKE